MGLVKVIVILIVVYIILAFIAALVLRCVGSVIRNPFILIAASITEKLSPVHAFFRFVTKQIKGGGPVVTNTSRFKSVTSKYTGGANPYNSPQTFSSINTGQTIGASTTLTGGAVPRSYDMQFNDSIDF